MAVPNDQFARYHRQMILPDFGVEAQQRLAHAHAVVIGCGALGTVVCESLARAGVGTLTIIDRDIVELTNLQRQTLFSEQDACDGVPKAVAAAARLRAINSQISITPIIADVASTNIESLIAAPTADDPADQATVGFKVIIDATDNFQIRYLINDVCVKHKLPWIYGGAVGTRGMQATFLPDPSRPCLRCIFPEPAAVGTTQTCDTVGVLGPVVGIVANVQAVEALKVLIGRTDLCSTSLLDMDPWLGQRRRLDLAAARDPACPCCGLRRFDFLNAPRSHSETSLCGQNAVQVSPLSQQRHGSSQPQLDLRTIAERWSLVGRVTATSWLVRAQIDDQHELTLFADGRAIIKGTSDLSKARSLYARFVGS